MYLFSSRYCFQSKEMASENLSFVGQVIKLLLEAKCLLEKQSSYLSSVL